ncbi:MAG: hypothetical protein JW773_10695 [Desulfuromonadales bacterium]|nr:hypothetical protein [Desulfuromonadales bacterium]
MQVSVNFVNTTALTVPKEAGRQQRQLRSADCYRQNASAAQVIDAEFIETTKPAAKNGILSAPQPVMIFDPPSAVTSTTASSVNPADRFRRQAADVPAPGTYLNIYA